MRIVVVGDGKVGKALSQNLSDEGHEIVIIDNDKQVIDDAVNTLDIVGVYGNGASYRVQTEAGVDKADLMIATTNSDEVNMLCCLIARKLGAKHTIARVRDPEYSDQLLFMREELGLSMQINPEYSTAIELFRILRIPSALKVETFSRGRVELIEIRLKEHSILDQISLRDIPHRLGVKVLVCAVQRDNELVIPDGNFRLHSSDKINVVAAPSEIAHFLQALGISERPAQQVMLVGGSHIAYYLGRMLLDVGAQVKIIDNDKERCLELCELLPKAMIIHGDGTDQDLLQEEGIATTDAVVTLTGMDEQNILISMYATSLKIGKVITKVNRPALASLVEHNGLESVISPKDVSTNQILSYVRGMQNSMGSNVETMYKLVSGQVEALEFRVHSSFPHKGIPLRNLRFKPNTLVACITRNMEIIIPFGNDKFQVNDRVIVVTTGEYFHDLTDILEE